MLIRDWYKECIGESNAKILCDEFGLVNIFSIEEFLNHEKFKTNQEGSTFIDYGLSHRDLIDQVYYVTYELFEYRKGKGDHRGWYFDIRETYLFGNRIDGVYKSNKRSLDSKNSKNIPKYLRAVNEYLIKHHVYKKTKNLLKSKRSHHKVAEVIDEDVTKATQYVEQPMQNTARRLLGL